MFLPREKDSLMFSFLIKQIYPSTLYEIHAWAETLSYQLNPFMDGVAKRWLA